MLYSIIIPTYNNFTLVSTCVRSIIQNTDFTKNDTEIIVIFNGDPSVAELFKDEFKQPYIKTLSYDGPLGYARATNLGITVSTGKYCILLNDDCQILDFAQKGEWLNMLRRPFDSSDRIGVTGPSKIYSKETERDFIIFFCAMIPRRIFFEIGILDTDFGLGGGEDIDFCARLVDNNYACVKVPEDNDTWSYTTNFPIYHIGEQTVHDKTKIPDWEALFSNNMNLLAERKKLGYYGGTVDVTCEISTRGRYMTTLPGTLYGILKQTVRPKKLLLFQDDPDVFDIRSSNLYTGIFNIFKDDNIEVELVAGDGSGQVKNHQKALEMATTEWIWRIDDDEIPESDVLFKLLQATDDSVGAVAPSVFIPGYRTLNQVSSKLADIYTHQNVQWSYPTLEDKNIVEAEHLYSTFLYRRSYALPYDVDHLSPVGHREETLFTHRIHRLGYKLLIVRDAVVLHMREQTGGIRTFTDENLWKKDEAYFVKFYNEWTDKKEPFVKRKWINLDGGMGDHYMFRMALPEIIAANPDRLITVAAAHPVCLEDEKNIAVVSVQDGINNMAGFSEMNVYAWCMRNNWKLSLIDAFKAMYTRN